MSETATPQNIISRREQTPSPCINQNLPELRQSRQIKNLLHDLPRLNDIFTIYGQIGEGTFSSVLLATLKSNLNHGNDTSNNNLFAIKHLVPTCHPSRIETELKCLRDIGGKDNVIGIHFCLREMNKVVFVMPFIQHQKFSDFLYDMDLDEIRLYIKNLLIALRRVHSFGIIHRDVKPSNFLYDRINKRFFLVDFGLAHPVKEEKTATLKRKNCDDNSIQNFENPSKRVALQSSVMHNNKNIFNKNNTYNKENNDIPVNILSFVSPHKYPLKNYNSVSISPKNIYNVSPMKKSPLKVLGLNLKIHPKVSPKKAVHSIKNVTRQLSFTEEKEGLVPQSKIILTLNQNKTKFENNTKQFSKPTSSNVHSNKKRESNHCQCFGKPRVCKVCLLKKGLLAHRAGTPGFRPPEVLLKYTKQTTAVDIWAVGVILLSLLSKCYPFFKSPDDLTALAEIITLFGSHNLKNVAQLLGRILNTSEERSPLDLRKLCEVLRSRLIKNIPANIRCQQCEQNKSDVCLCYYEILKVEMPFPDSAYDLLKKLLDTNPFTRITAEQAINHPFLNDQL